MPKTNIQFLKDRLSMMETEGWYDLIEDLKNLEEGIINIDNIHSEKDLWIIKGQLRILNFLLSLDTATNLALEESQEENPT